MKTKLLALLLVAGSSLFAAGHFSIGVGIGVAPAYGYYALHRLLRRLLATLCQHPAPATLGLEGIGILSDRVTPGTLATGHGRLMPGLIGSLLDTTVIATTAVTGAVKLRRATKRARAAS
jgi:hypothetical protein